MELNVLFSATDIRPLADLIREWRRYAPPYREKTLQALASQLTSVTESRMTETGNMAILHRVVSGEMPFPARGTVIVQDIFIKGGRAAWAIEKLIGIQFPGSLAITHELDNEVREARVAVIRAFVQTYLNGVRDGRESQAEGGVRKGGGRPWIKPKPRALQ
ncbi:MAG: hypothetical protein HN380_30675 [Victivallales bacterium]|jgi:hypothetical protein|nr:hypothetical protein [Victivallales bacterium]